MSAPTYPNTKPIMEELSPRQYAELCGYTGWRYWLWRLKVLVGR